VEIVVDMVIASLEFGFMEVPQVPPKTDYIFAQLSMV
jgi:hypothetical protein